MHLAYLRVSKADGSQVVDLQRDAVLAVGIEPRHIYEDYCSGSTETRPGLDACLKALRAGDTLVVWKLDRLGRSLKHLVQIVEELTTRGIGLQVLTGQGAQIDTTTTNGKLIFAIFAALAEYERALIIERTRAGLAAARARGRKGGRRFKLTSHQALLATNSKQPASEVAKALGVSRWTVLRARQRAQAPKQEVADAAD